MRRILNKKIIIAVVAIILVLSALVYAAAERESFVRYAIFRTSYSIPVARGWMLRQYSNFLDNHNGGYMGEAIDTFLCARLESNPSESEMAAILEYYSLRAGGREGYQISKISDAAKQQAIPLVLQRVDFYEKRQSSGALLIIEDMRRGETLSKGGFGPADKEWAQPNFSFDKWWAERGLSETKTKYKQWWHTNVAWSQKRLIDPLSASNVKVTYIP